MKKIVLISPYPPAQNPRLLKEYKYLKVKHFDVQVLYAERDKWASNFRPLSNEKFLIVGGKYGSLFYYFTRLIHKIFRNILPLKYGFDRVSWLLYIRASSIKADLYIAHNLAALPIAVKAAKKNNAKCGFDAEDFHRQEISDDINSKPYQLSKFIEDKYLSQVDYLTAASPLIAAQYQKIYPDLKTTVINNAFSIDFLKKASNKRQDKRLKLFWFSQTIGKGRGLEDVIQALNIIDNPLIELHLLGNLQDDVKSDFNNLAKFKIHYYYPVSNTELFMLAAKFDVGLALELRTPLNRDICLTNKLFTYLLSGLAIIASKTQAQEKFIKENEGIGILYTNGSINELANAVRKLYDDKIFLNDCKYNAYQLAQVKYNWEMESKKFIEVVKRTLAN